MKFSICILIVLCPLWGWAQSSSINLPLSVGDKVPDLTFDHVLFAPYTSSSILSNSDKLYIVDFWATWCTSCIKEFPKLDSLQDRFKNQIQLLLIDSSPEDSEAIIKNFFDKRRNPSGKKYSFPVITDNKRMNKLFPHRSLPHTVWIYKGKVKAITSADEVTAKNISSILSGEQIHMVQKKEKLDFDFNLPLIQGGNGGETSSIISKTLFTRYLDGVGSPVGNIADDDKITRRRVIINNPILQFYAYAYPNLPKNRVILEDNLSTILISTNEYDSAWKANNFYCYESTVPFKTSLEELRIKLRKDFDNQFDLISRIEKRKVSCYNLVLVNDSLKLNQADKPESSLAWQLGDDKIHRMINRPLSEFVAAMNAQIPGRPVNPIVFDETGYKGLADIELSAHDIHDIQAVKRELEKYGLSLIPVEKELDMLVLSKSKVK